MRILHLSDVHIGVENYGRTATQEDLDALPKHFAPGVDRDQYLGVSTRLLDFLSTLDAAVDHALNHGIDLVLFAGDAYKARDPSQTHQREFARRIVRLSQAGISVFLTVGNHDLPHSANRATAVEIFPTLQVQNVTVGDSLNTYLVSTRAGDVQVVALPWVRIGQFMARDETRNLTLERITREVERRLTDLLKIEVESLDPSLPAVLCAHVTASGAVASSERSMMLGTDHVLNLGTLADPSFDYVALGHIHKHQVLTQHPLVVYPGSLQRIDFSEEKDTKGFCVFDLDPSKPRGERISGFQFQPVDARPMLTVDVRVRPGQDPTDATLTAIERHSGDGLSGAIVRLRVEMPAEAEPAFRETAVRQALAPAHYVAGIDRRVQRDRRTRLGTETAESLSPMEALRRYLESRNTPADRQRHLLEYGERLIREEIEGPEE
jgi:exonuclease SbcD